MERTVKQLRTTRLVGDAPTTEGDVDIQDEVDLEGLSRMASEALGHDQAAVPSEAMEEREEEEAPLSADVLPQATISESAGPSAAADKGKAPMPELDIPAEFLAEDAQARQRFEEEQASERLVQRLRAEDLAQEYMPNVSEERAKELDELMMRSDVTEANFVERMTAIKERKKRALADLRYRALKAHHGTITMKAVKAMSKQQLSDEYEYICKRLEKDRLLNAQYNLFRPKPVISEPPSKRQRVDRDPADTDSAGGGSFNPAGSATPMTGFAVPDTADGTLGTTGTASTVPTSATMDSAALIKGLGCSAGLSEKEKENLIWGFI
ncbi:hypothetical protein Tco_1295498 [Tanacetum coccineum]